jgi:hypothetical protein
MTTRVLTVTLEEGERFELPSNNAGPLVASVESVPSGVPGTPLDVGLTNLAGTSGASARSDHVHALTAAIASAVYAANWAEPAWFIDGTTGNDANNGTTALTPLRTGAELLRRLGPYALWGQSVTVTVGANGMADALILRGVMLVAGTHLDVVGTPTQLTSAGNVATYAAVNHATATGAQVTATGIVDWTIYQWRRLRCTSGARAGLTAWIATANPAGAGVATARLCPPIMVDTTNNASNVIQTAFVAGDPLVIETVPVVPEISIRLDGPISTAGTSQYARRLYSVQSVDCPTMLIDTNADTMGRKSLIFGCALSAVGQTSDPNSNNTASIILNGCLIYCADLSLSGVLTLAVRIANCLVGLGVTTLAINEALNGQNITSQGAALSAPYFIAAAVQVFDVPGATSVAFSTKNAQITNLSGSGNAGIGIGIANPANCRLSGTVNLTATVTNGRLTSTPTVDLTLPQLLQPSDYAQKGTTTAMVAGSVTVTVPWYDNANQKVQATHATPGGTLGILSVVQTSTTQFTINSSSALDTSTVNWQISPLGRNVFVVTS